MSLNIKNEQTHRLVRQLAELTGQTQTSAVEDAVRRRLEELESDGSRQQRLAALTDIVDRAQAIVATDRTWRAIDFDADLYDANGLAR